MKRFSRLLAIFILFASLGMAGSAWSETQATQDQKIDKSELQGQIKTIDYVKNVFLLKDERGFEKRIMAKQGMIGTFKVGDRVKVKMMKDNKEAKMVHKL